MLLGLYQVPGYMWVRYFNVFLVESNWKKVVTLKTEHDSLMLCNFSNTTGTTEEYFTWNLGVSFGVMNTVIIVNIIVTWKLKTLHQDDHKDCQCQWSKNKKGKNRELFVDEHVW